MLPIPYSTSIRFARLIVNLLPIFSQKIFESFSENVKRWPIPSKTKSCNIHTVLRISPPPPPLSKILDPHLKIHHVHQIFKYWVREWPKPSEFYQVILQFWWSQYYLSSSFGSVDHSLVFPEPDKWLSTLLLFLCVICRNGNYSADAGEIERNMG